MLTFTAKEYTATTYDGGVTFTPATGTPLNVPYGALSEIRWAPNVKKTSKGKTPLTAINFIYRNVEQNKLPKPIRMGESFADATPENINFVAYVRTQIAAATPLPEWKQDVDPAKVKKARTTNRIIGVVLTIGLIAAVAVGFSKCSGGDDKPAGTDPEPTRGAAMVACNDAVRDQLKAPSTARFPMGERSIREVKGDDGKIESYAYSAAVDAENSFGAKIRTYFVCTATVESDGSLSAVATLIED
nr:MAG TPA: hypothetical protein [Caudoviricetes sp.]